jgi:hypothetical protein
VDHLHIPAQLELHPGEVRHAAGAERCVVDLARSLARHAHDVRHAVRRKRRMHHEEERHGVDYRDRREILDRVVGERLHRRRVAGVCGKRADQHRVAVGRGLRHEIGGDDPVRAGAVLDHDRLPERDAEILGQAAPAHVHAAAGRVRDHHADGFRGPRLRVHDTGDEQGKEGDQRMFHYSDSSAC